MTSNHCTQLKNAMNEEIDSMNRNKTWVSTTIPNDRYWQSLRKILSIVAIKGMHLIQFHIKTVFLYGCSKKVSTWNSHRRNYFNRYALKLRIVIINKGYVTETKKNRLVFVEILNLLKLYSGPLYSTIIIAKMTGEFSIEVSEYCFKCSGERHNGISHAHAYLSRSSTIDRWLVYLHYAITT